jgi:hypothetical protein
MVVLGNPMLQAPFNFNKNGWINGAFRSKHDTSILATQECLIFIYLVTNFNINLLIEFLATMFLALTFTLGNEGPTTQLGFVFGNPMVEVGFNLGYDMTVAFLLVITFS